MNDIIATMPDEHSKASEFFDAIAKEPTIDEQWMSDWLGKIIRQAFSAGYAAGHEDGIGQMTIGYRATRYQKDINSTMDWMEQEMG